MHVLFRTSTRAKLENEFFLLRKAIVNTRKHLVKLTRLLTLKINLLHGLNNKVFF